MNGTPVIQLRGVGLRYRSQRRAALEPVNLTVWPGELVALTGPAGSGKSTLLNLIGLLDRPTTGSYLLNGLDTARLSDSKRAALRGAHIGFVFQKAQLLTSRSALDNVTLPLLYQGIPAQERMVIALDMLDHVDLADRAQCLASRMSAGELQRVVIARALINNPDLLLCDDPTASLDALTGERIVALLAGLRSRGVTVLVATRDQLTAGYSTNCVTLGRSQASDPAIRR